MLTLEEAAEQLGCSTRTVQRLIDSGELTAYKVGGRWKVRTEDLEAYLASVRAN